MSIQKWHPFSEIEGLRKEMERLIDEFFPTKGSYISPVWKKGSEEIAVPTVDVVDREDEVLVSLEMPGVDKDNIDVSIEDDTLTVKGTITRQAEQKEENYIKRERTYSSFERTLRIPVKINPEKIKAVLKNGVLEIHLPKAEEVKPKKIKIDVS